MHNAIKWIDTAQDSPTHKVLINHQLNIPGLVTFGYHNTTKATSPLVLHYHENCIEITYVVKGHIIFYCENHPHHIYGGNLFITPPNVIHSTGDSSLSSCEVFWLQIDLSTSPIFGLDKHWSSNLISRLSALPPQVIKAPSNTRSLLSSCFEVLYQGSDSAYLAISNLLCFIHNFLEQPPHQDELSDDIHNVLNYILDNLSENISLDDLSKFSNLSLSRLKQKFKSQIGMTPGEFINSRKIELAKNYLLENPSVTDVAFRLGFSSSNYFAVVFKRVTGLSPSEYIKTIQKTS